jgi:small GTP-binding protein
VKDVDLDFQGMPLTATLTIWDIAGHETFRPLLPAYHKGANGAFFVVDLTRVRSFENISVWYQDLCTNLEEQVPIVFLANKCDLEHYVDEDYIAETAASVNAIATFTTSAKTGENVQASFDALVQEMVKQYNNEHPEFFIA